MLVEREFRSRLEEALPEKAGVSRGFAADPAGGVSKQTDIVPYDRMNAPRILASDGARMFPAETTCAARGDKNRARFAGA